MDRKDSMTEQWGTTYSGRALHK